MGEKGLNMDVE